MGEVSLEQLPLRLILEKFGLRIPKEFADYINRIDQEIQSMAYNILIVDDSSIIRKSLKKTLGLANLELGSILEAENGAKALEILKANWMDLVFLDINMPVMNGVEFLQKLRSDDQIKDTAVIVVSTEGSEIRAKELQNLGVKALLRKPVRPEVLASTVVEILAGSDQQGQLDNRSKEK